MEKENISADRMILLSQKYEGNIILRSVISMLPTVGGGLDILLSAKWNSFRERRLDQMLTMLSQDLKSLEKKVNKEYLQSEEFYDVIYQVLNESIKTRLDEKRKIYSKIIRDSISQQRETMETESVLEIISNLHQMDFIFIDKINAYKNSQINIEFSGEDMFKFLSNETFSISEIVRILYRFSYLGLLDYKVNVLTLREKVKFSTTPFYECILTYLKE